MLNFIKKITSTSDANEQYLIKNEKEQSLYLKELIKSKKLSLKFLNSKHNPVLSEQGILFIQDENFALEIFSNGNNPTSATSVKVEGTSNGVKIVFESEITQTIIDGSTKTFIIKKPKNLYRFQRRNSYRINVPINYKLTITLDPTISYLRNLPIINLSDSGALVSVKCPHDHYLKKGLLFGKATFKISEGKTKNFEVKTSVKYFFEDISKEIKNRINQDNEKIFKMGLHFEKLPAGMFNELNLIMGELRKLNNQ